MSIPFFFLWYIQITGGEEEDSLKEPSFLSPFFNIKSYQLVVLSMAFKTKPHWCTSWNPDRLNFIKQKTIRINASPRKSVEWEKALQLLEILAQKLGCSAAFQWLRMCFWWHLMLSSMMSGFARLYKVIPKLKNSTHKNCLYTSPFTRLTFQVDPFERYLLFRSFQEGPLTQCHNLCHCDLSTSHSVTSCDEGFGTCCCPLCAWEIADLFTMV